MTRKISYYRMGIVFLVVAILLSVFCIGLSGCSQTTSSNSSKENGKVNIVTTIFPEYDLARAIAGDKANVDLLISPGTSVHSFDPSPTDIRTIQNADVFIYVGGISDAWTDNILSSLDTEDMKIVRLMDFVDTFPEELKEGMMPEEDSHDGDSDEEHEGAVQDEHIWTSPKNAIILLQAIADALCETDSANSEAYRKNAEDYSEKLKEVDSEIEEVIANADRNKIVVADKFPFLYFVKHYGLEYSAAFMGCSDQTDAGAATISFLIDVVESENISYIYKVELTNGNVAEAISEQTGAGILMLYSGENISKDDFDKGVLYVDLMEKNIENLKKGLN